MSGMHKYGGHQLRFGDKISEREPNLEKSVFLTRYGTNICSPKNIVNKSL